MSKTDYKSIVKKLKFEGRAYINGKYVDAIDGGKFENINPATGETLCSIAKCNYKDCYPNNLILKIFFCNIFNKTYTSGSC